MLKTFVTAIALLWTVPGIAAPAAPSPLTPHVQQVETSLSSALARVTALQSELKQAPQPAHEGKIKQTAQQISSDIGKAVSEQAPLEQLTVGTMQGQRNDDYEQMTRALEKLRLDNQNLRLRIEQRGFVQDRDTALNDLASISRTLQSGLKHARSFNQQLQGTG